MSLLSCVLILGCRAHQAAFVLFDEPAITNLPVTGTVPVRDQVYCWCDVMMPWNAQLACAFAAAGDLESLRVLPAAALVEFDAHGSAPVHWAASCGHVHVLAWLIEEARVDAECEGLISSRGKRRRPLHWAARNGRLAAVRYLVESARVDPDPRDKQSVSPFQLAVWQCWLEVARYLVENAGVDVTQVNVYACGAQHWLGTVPSERAADLLPMAHWLKASGVDWSALQRQGHRPLHKAAWGGHLELCRWLRDECGAVDDLPDHSGNYAADVAEMYGHVHIAAWLRSECSGARAISCAALGLPPSTTCHATIRARYLALARRYHPDRQMALSSAKKMGTASAAHDAAEAAAEAAADEEFDQSPMGDGDAPTAAVGDDAAEASGIHSSFETVRAAYVHLIQEGGRGVQCNPTLGRPALHASAHHGASTSPQVGAESSAIQPTSCERCSSRPRQLLIWQLRPPTPQVPKVPARLTRVRPTLARPAPTTRACAAVSRRCWRPSAMNMGIKASR